MGGTHTHTVHHVIDPNHPDIVKLRTILDQLDKDLSTAKDPKQAAAAIDRAKQGVYTAIKEKPLPKQRDLSMVVIGPTSAGKTTLLNKMFGLNLKTSARKCTDGVNLVETVQGLEIYDVFGTNPKQLYLQWDAVRGIATKHIALVCFSDAMENCIDAIDLAVAGGLKVVVVRTKKDTIPTDEVETPAEIFAAEAVQAQQLGAHYYFAVSAEKDPASVTDLKNRIFAALSPA
jgi:GTP-binding protein EngB required for normal cell division